MTNISCNPKGYQGRIEGHNFRNFDEYKLISIKKSNTF